jgi:predicted AAA+ superfamily ATPase
MPRSSLYPRQIESRIAEAMGDTPVVMLAGPRQAGKTTLVRQISAGEARYLTLDDELTLMSAREDPVGMIRSLDRFAALAPVPKRDRGAGNELAR